MRVVCTAGHVDHGKSTLVRALTGMEPDRLAEEQRRGLTIDLGFAWADLAPGRTVAFVDLPGHERFVGTMLAGAGPVELALFVVAADEGWMPQSAEHLDILDLLGVSRGVVGLTKIDTVDEETVAIAEELVREQLAPTALAGVEIVPVSGVTGAGLDRLTAALLGVLAHAPSPADRGRPRLWVDRSFTVRGAGTVVTGTLSGGVVRVGDELTVLPGSRAGRVRGLQSIGQPRQEAEPGAMVAVNLAAVQRDEVERGDALGRAGDWLAVRALDAEVRALPGIAIGSKGAWHLHAGSGERTARLFPIDRGLVRIELDRPLALTAGDRFVLREAGRRATAGGGRVLDADPPPRLRGAAARRARGDALRARIAALDAGDLTRLLRLHTEERGAATLATAAAAVGLTVPDAAAAPDLLPLGTAVVAPDAAQRWGDAVVAALAAEHVASPLARVAPRDTAERAALRAGCPASLVDAFLTLLVAQGRIVAATGPSGTGLRTPQHAVRLDPAQAATRDAVLRALCAEPFAPPALSVVAARTGAPTALVRELEAVGVIVRLAPDLAVATSALDEAVDRLGRAAHAEGPLSAARAKEVLGTSRKYALPLLEELDRRGRTRRRGDVREVLG